MSDLYLSVKSTTIISDTVLVSVITDSYRFPLTYIWSPKFSLSTCAEIIVANEFGLINLYGRHVGMAIDREIHRALSYIRQETRGPMRHSGR